MASGIGSSVRSKSLSVFGPSLKDRQLDTLQHLVTKHIQDPAANGMDVKSDDFMQTTDERGVSRWEHGHLIAALDTLNAYQRDRRARSKMHLGSHRAGFRHTYQHDPRTRFVELLKRWLRTNAATTNLTEDAVRKMSSLCRDVMNHPTLFPARNERSFMKTIAEVYQHLEVQLREVLEHDRTCAELAQHVLSLSRNLVSDAIGYLLVGPTDLKRTDELPSLEVVSLWASLPSDSHPLPGRMDQKMQSTMRDAWGTHCGTLISGLLRTAWCVRLFEGAGAQQTAAATPRLPSSPSLTDMPTLLENLKSESSLWFGGGPLKTSGLAGSFRKPEAHPVRRDYLAAVEVLLDLTYLIGEALVQFHRISDGLGDYGMIRVATWLHPFLEALTEKVLRLKSHLESLNRAVDEHLIVAKARGYAVEKPSPSQQMGQRAHLAIERAVIQSSSHVQLLVQEIDKLRQRSSPDRLPQVEAEIGDACLQLDAMLSSAQFRACVGDRFPNLPRICEVAMGQPQHELEGDTRVEAELMDVIDLGSPLAATHCLRTAAALPGQSPEHLTPAATSLPNPSELPEAVIAASIAQASAKAFQDIHQLPLRMQQSASETADEDRALPLQADVFRLTGSYCGPGLRRHDRRALRLQGSKIDVFEKGSTFSVKSSIDIRCDVEDCFLSPGNKRLSLVIRRIPKGADSDCGVRERKTYAFEFGSCDEAIAFHSRILKLSSP